MAHVSDIVSLNDIVWVKVIDVQVETTTSSDDATTSGKTRSRHRVKLSMKYVNQDSGKDLDPENQLFEEDQQRILNSSGNGSSYHRGEGSGNHHDSGANSLLGRSLVSNIGMSTAIDPGSLIIRGAKGVNGSPTDALGCSSFNGYALVDDDEGEPSPPPLPIIHDAGMDPSLSSSSLMASNVIPMGRGRGMTLPAWMTKRDTTAEKLGSGGGCVLLPNESTNQKNDYDDEKSRRRRHDVRHHTSITKERHNKLASSNADSSWVNHERSDNDHHRQRRRRRRRDSSSSYSSKETQRSSSPKKYRSRLRSVELHSHRSRSHSRKRKKSHHRHHDKHYRSDRSSSSKRHDKAEYSCPSRTSKIALSIRSQHHQSMKSSEFTNVEEARAIVERLERRR